MFCDLSPLQEEVTYEYVWDLSPVQEESATCINSFIYFHECLMTKTSIIQEYTRKILHPRESFDLLGFSFTKHS